MEEGTGEEYTYTNCFVRMQKIEGRQRAQVTVLQKSTDCPDRSVVSSFFLGVQNQTQRPENEYNMACLTAAMDLSL